MTERAGFCLPHERDGALTRAGAAVVSPFPGDSGLLPIPARAGDLGCGSSAGTTAEVGSATRATGVPPETSPASAAHLAVSPADAGAFSVTPYTGGSKAGFIRANADAIRSLRAQGSTWKQLGRLIGMDWYTLRQTWQRNHNGHNPRRKSLRDLREPTIRLRAEGLEWAEVGRILGVNPRSLAFRASADGWGRE